MGRPTNLLSWSESVTNQKKKIEIGDLFWTNEPMLGVAFDFDCDKVHPWQGRVVKVIGESIWLRHVDAPDPDNDPNGLFTAIVNIDDLHPTREEVPCESQ